ncbi:PhoX family phosphatase [Variovorax sp. J22G21]|uniref:PhoX family protein n=1 Tax=Variovorax fucosicus TaxID=3053517 RepID=UPI0025750C83|nr:MULTISPECIES: PhoX family phosphatase [unclassified Variovorax]MDM0038227.1 PhoX family phosphatase [Variovorax sp. J22R193]MDM0063003.1 PhoX family phosphatase [Variovorax sp. J22G21]
MAKDFSTMEDSNRSANPSIHEVSDPARRIFVRGGLAATVAGLLGPLAAGCASTGGGNMAAFGRSIGFKSIPMAAIDDVVVPEGYSAQVLYRWGDPVGIAGQMPAFRPDGSNTAAEQALQAGMHHDGMAFFPVDGSSQRGILVMNHEYVDDGLLHVDGMKTWTAEKVRKAINAHGVSVIEIQREGNAWKQVLPSKFARRITAATPMTITGPAAGHAMLKTAADPTGTRALGTFNNCSNGQTPWGTYLTCEENFADYFEGVEQPDAHQRRWGIRKGNGAKYRWHEHEERFDVAKHPNESNRFGWVVEIDPQDPTATPIKRSALGRAAHEGAATALTADGRAVVYMGEDSRFEYIYKFVSRDRVKPGGFAANRELLDHGTLYVGRFDVEGTGEWLPLTQGKGPLTTDKGFASQGDVLIKARQASDALGATKMDRPEWTTVDPITKEVYCTLTNNSNRGASGQPGVDPANPRVNNTMGQIIRWKEAGDLDATRFAWNHLVLAGDPKQGRWEAQGNIKGDTFGSPDGLRVDARGVLWIQTDVSTSTLGKGEYSNLPNNQMLACDPTKGEIRRFLVGPAGCEITGLTATPDLRSLFINVQHPGEPANERSDPDKPLAVSKWPDGGGRPRSATVVITKNDGGVVGT